MRDKRRLQQLNHRLIDDHDANAHLGETHVVRIDYGAEVLWAFPQLQTVRTELTVRNLRTMYQKAAENYAAMAAPVRKASEPRADIDRRSFEAFSKNMDAKFAKKRKFGGIALLNSYPKKQYDSLDDAIDAVTNPAPTDFCNSRAMVVGFGMTNAVEYEIYAKRDD